MGKILIVEDEKKLRKELKIYLENNHYQVEVIDDFSNVYQQMEQSDVDLILLDLKLPYNDGKELCRDYRHRYDTPIIIVTSQNDEMNELMCIQFGADDFISKPYNPLILLARIERVLQRSQKLGQHIDYCGMSFDISKGLIEKDGQVIELSKNELKILNYLLMNQGQIQSRDQIMTYLWNSDMFVDDNTLTVNINRLRHKLSAIGLNDVIKTKRGQGYFIS